MLENLDNVAWDQLYHAYGAAGDVPEMLRGLGSHDESIRRWAESEIRKSIIHQGGYWEATKYTIPFLFELVEKLSTPHRKSIMGLLLNIATGNDWLNDRSLPIQENRFSRVDGLTAVDYHHYTVAMYERDPIVTPKIWVDLAIIWERDTYLTMQEHTDQLLALTHDDELQIALYAISAIPWFPKIHQKAVLLLQSFLTPDHPIEVRATVTLTLGFLTAADPDIIEKILQAQLQRDDSHILRLIGAIALANLKPEINEQTLKILIEAEEWRGEINANPQIIPYKRPLMGFRSLALQRLGL